ncbi:TolC family protein [Brevibacillus sp. SIMBA_040]|uniref:TolC family protein n=1 Tax=unclassified Brevibacillus TaxID=2684853 RepID=UPI00397DA216
MKTHSWRAGLIILVWLLIGNDTIAMGKTQQELEVLTLDQSIMYALETGRDVKRASLIKENATYSLVSANIDVRKYNEDDIKSLELQYEKHKANKGLEKSCILQQQSVNETIKLITTKFYNLVHAELELDLVNRRLNRTGELLVWPERLNTQDSKLINGNITFIKEVQLKAQEAVDSERKILNEVLRVDPLKNWLVLNEGKSIDIVKITEEEAFEKNIKLNIDVMQKELDLKYLYLDRDLYDAYFRLHTFDGKILKNNIKIALLDLEDAKEKVKKRIVPLYQEYKNVSEKLENGEKAKVKADEIFRLKRQNFLDGIVTLAEVLKAEEELANREKEYNSLLHKYRECLFELLPERMNTCDFK